MYRLRAGRVDLKLAADVLPNTRRDIRGVRQKGPQISHRRELQGKAELVVIAAALSNQRAVDVVNVK